MAKPVTNAERQRIRETRVQEFRAQLYRDGLPSNLADNDALGRIRLASSLFAAGLLAIHSSYTDLIDELTGYAWDLDTSDKGVDEPLKIDGHGPDQLRYAVKTTEAIWRSHVRLEIAA